MEKCMDMDMDNHMCIEKHGYAGKNMDRYCFSFYT